jgi:hypothetical protein
MLSEHALVAAPYHPGSHVTSSRDQPRFAKAYRKPVGWKLLKFHIREGADRPPE